jgi:hypothetical protein
LREIFNGRFIQIHLESVYLREIVAIVIYKLFIREEPFLSPEKDNAPKPKRLRRKTSTGGIVAGSKPSAVPDRDQSRLGESA